MDETQSEKTIGEELLLGYPGDSSKEDFDITHEELSQIKEAMKDEKFRKLLSDYVEDVRDPANQLTYQTEMRQLEKERGNIVHFINPIPGFVLKTSVDGKKKAFINVCSNPLIKRPTFETATQNNKTGTLWSIPYSQSAGKDDMDKARKGCTVYDVIFNPETLRMSKQNKVLQQKLEETALEAVEKSFAVVLDKNNVRRPKLRYKGMKIASTIRYPIGDSPPDCIDPNQLEKELPPQPDEVQNFATKDEMNKASKKKDAHVESNNENNIKGSGDADFVKPTDSASATAGPAKNRPEINKPEESTVPIYSIKYRSFVDMQDYVIDNQREGRSHKPIPDEVILTIDLPLLRNSASLSADVIEDGWFFELISDKSALYRLKFKLPFQVHNDAGKAIFDKDKRKLSITMKTVQKSVGFVFPEPEPGEQIETVEEVQRPSGLRSSLSRSIDSTNDLPFESMSLSDPSPSPPDDSSGHLLSSSVGSLGSKKSVSFSDVVQRQLYRSNSSILGQKKKNQRKAKNKRKARERLNSGESISSMDDEHDGAGGTGRAPRQRIYSGESISSMDDENENDLDAEVLENLSGEED